MWGRHHHLVCTVCNYSMCTADVIRRSAYIMHDCCLAEITEHFFPSHQTYQIPCALFSSLIIFKLHRDHVVVKVWQWSQLCQKWTWETYDIPPLETCLNRPQGRTVSTRPNWTLQIVGEGGKRSPLFFFESSPTRSLCGEFGWKTERDTCHESRAHRNTHSHSLPLCNVTREAASRRSLTLKGGMQHCHSRVREGLKTDSTLGVCIQ